MVKLHLILGGARSGKSLYAEKLALQSGKKLVYLATAQVWNKEMQERVLIHQKRRCNDWNLIESPLQLAKVLKKNDASNNCILVDCLTLWLTNCLCHSEDEKENQTLWQQEKHQLLSVLKSLSSNIIFVSNEVGSGIVPLGELSRQFADEAGLLHQELAKICDNVTLVVAGLPLTLKSEHDE